MQFVEGFCTIDNHETGDFIINVPNENGLCPIVKRSIKKIIKNENYSTYNTISLKPLPADHGNFLGDLIEIDIKGKTEDGEKENNIFVKHTVPEEGYLKGQVNVKHCYTNEVFMYVELHKVFKELYEEFGVPKGQRLRTVKSYDCNEHVIILENLSPKGFKCLHRLDIMPIDFATDAIKQMAKLHTLSFAIEYKRPDYFEKYVKTLKMPVYVEDENGELYDNWKNFMIKMVNETFEHNIVDAVKTKKDYLIKELFEKIPKYYTGKYDSVRCLCHGDFKHDNILFKKNPGEEIETVAIDYQLINYGSPMGDIFYFLYTGADRTFRQEHMEDLKNIYYETFKEGLQYFDLNVDNIYPRDIFEKDFKDSLEYGLLSSLYLLPRNLSEDPEFFRNDMTGKKEIGLLYYFALLPVILTEDPEFIKKDLTIEIPKTSDIFKESINIVIDELTELRM